MFCSACKDLFRCIRAYSDGLTPCPKLGSPEKCYVYSFAGVYGARRSCSFCARIWLSLQVSSETLQSDTEVLKMLHGDTSYSIRIDFQGIRDDSNKRLVEMKINNIVNGKPSYIRLSPCLPDESTLEQDNGVSDHEETRFKNCTENHKSENCDRAFNAIVSHIQQWLQNTNMQMFNRVFNPDPAKKGFVPTRLIEIDPVAGQHLVERASLNESVSYATLSHVWGRRYFETLTTRCYKSLQQCVPDSMLTNTFRDAVQVCRTLGIRYLWIDSFCIIQDSRDDWKHESALMHLVYGNSYLNIAATASRDGSGGLFGCEKSILLQPCTVELFPGCWYEAYLRSHKERATAVRPRSDEGLGRALDGTISFHQSAFERSPLFSRGWIVQEIFLAPRTLHFAETQLWWCSKDHGCFSQMSPDLAMFAMQRSSHMFSWALTPEVTAKAKPTVQSLDEFWDGIVDDFSRTHVTKFEDRIVALAGMVQALQRTYSVIGTKSAYVAGLWLHKILERLLWTVSNPAFALNEEESISLEPKEMCKNEDPTLSFDKRQTGIDVLEPLAPSWSWISVNRAVRYGLLREANQVDDRKDRQTMVSRVTKVQVDYSVPGQYFGKMLGGVLGLCGPLIRCVFEDHKLLHLLSDPVCEGLVCSKYLSKNHGGSTFAVGGLSRLLFDDLYDAESELPSRLELLMIGAAHNEELSEHSASGLILQRLEGQHGLIRRRMGVWHFYSIGEDRMKRAIKDARWTVQEVEIT